MTKRYMTAKELRITEKERHYLIKAYHLLKKMQPEQEVKIPRDGIYIFDMNHEKITRGCGTAGCIVGLCRILARTDGKQFEKYKDNLYSDALYYLFFPRDGFHHRYISYDEITPLIAANAIHRFLTTNVICF